MVGLAEDVDARTLVARLSSERKAERDASSSALEALGEKAVPPLLEAADSSDLVLRARAAALLDRIEGRILTRASVVKLDLANATPLEAVAQVAKQTTYTITLEPDTSPKWRVPSLNIHQELTFWEAIDQISRASEARLQPSVGPWNRRAPNLPGDGRPRRTPNVPDLVLREDSSPLPPISDAGAFRTTLLALSLNRSRNFHRTPIATAAPEAIDSFTAQVQLRAEPRLTVSALEAVRLIEAVDDRGNSLITSDLPATVTRSSRGFAGSEDASRNAPFVLSMRYPDDPGERIVRLRGSVRAVVSGGLGTQVIINLAAIGKPVTAAETRLTIHEVRPIPNAKGCIIQVEIDSPEIANPPQTGNGLPDPRNLPPRPAPSSKGRLDFYDANDRLCQHFDLGQMGLPATGSSRTALTVQPPEGVGPPATARYIAVSWTSIEIPFEFRDLPMP